ncbi:MAG: SMC-Scp complex subunit ScpB [Lachnospiraceae bacterium]|nr:SMC-Scp complex subunit ScpB [Lachnospiraceae bacterium]
MSENNTQFKKAVEGILFAMGKSVGIDRIAEALEISKEDVIKICDDLAAEYEADGRGFRVMRIEDAYQMCSAKEVYEYLIRIAKQPRKYVLTDTVLETLSIIAYKQPVTKAEIEKIRGVSSDHAVSKLVDFELVEEVGRMDAPGRPMLFGTTEEFLRVFGVTSLEELPSISPVQIEEYRQQAENEVALEVDV